MLSTDEVLVEDWQGLESELERLFMIYGYPVDDLQDTHDPVDSQAREVGEPTVSGDVIADLG